jgi:hypothetical protein
MGRDRCRKHQRRSIVALAAAVTMLALAGATPALANTDLFVNHASGTDAGTCQTSAAACKTISYAVTQERLAADIATIHVAAGTYPEDLALNGSDTGLTITGAGSGTDAGANTIIQGIADANATIATSSSGALALAHLRVASSSTDTGGGVTGTQTELAVNDVAVDVEGTGPGLEENADIDATGGAITLANITDTANAVQAAGQVSVAGTPIDVKGNGHGILNVGGPVTVRNGPITIEGTVGSSDAVSNSGGAVSIDSSPIDVSGLGYGVSNNIGAVTVVNSPITLEAATGFGYGVSSSGGSVTVAGSPIDVHGTGYGVNANGGALTLTKSPVTLELPTGTGYGVNNNGGTIAIDSSPIDIRGTGYGVNDNSAALTLTNSPVTLENASGSGYGVNDNSGSIAVTGSAIDVRGTGFGINDNSGAITVANSPVTLEDVTGTGTGISDNGGSLTVDSSAIDVRGTGVGLTNTSSTTTLRGISVTMENPASSSVAIQSSSGRMSLSGSTVSGGWAGSDVVTSGSVSIADSTLTSGPTPANPLSSFSNAIAGREVSIVRSTLQEQSPTKPAISAGNVDTTLDSSLILGGSTSLFGTTGGFVRSTNVVSSTVDAGALGTRDAGPIAALTATSDNTAGSRMLVNVQGSVLVEPPAATRAGTNGTSIVNCSTTEVPGTTQAATAALGTISCATGVNGNTSTASPAAIFANPGTDYAPNPAFSGVDSVPESAIVIPGGGAPSATDLKGHPRVINGVGTCLPGTRDKGAIELSGHSGVVPAPAIAGPATVTRGVLASFSGSAPNAPGAGLTWSSSDGGTGAGPAFGHTFAATGTDTVTLTATGAAGCTGTTSATINVRAPAVVSRAALSKLKLTPASFFAATSGATVAKTKAKPKVKRTFGTVITYLDTKVAKTTFTVTYKSTGRRRGKSCVKTTKANGKAKHCTLTVKAGTFVHTDKAGSNKLRFSGRIGGHKLAKRAYRLTAVPRTSAGLGRSVGASFHIKG